MNKVDSMIIAGKNALYRAKEEIKDFFAQERGGAEIVATIVLVAIVVLLAVAFREQLEGLVKGIWDGITDKSNALNNDFNLGN